MDLRQIHIRTKKKKKIEEKMRLKWNSRFDFWRTEEVKVNIGMPLQRINGSQFRDFSPNKKIEFKQWQHFHNKEEHEQCTDVKCGLCSSYLHIMSINRILTAAIEFPLNSKWAPVFFFLHASAFFAPKNSNWYHRYRNQIFNGWWWNSLFHQNCQ